MLNKVMLIGNLGKDPELKYTQSGVAVCSFTLATSKSWVNQQGQRQDKTEWHNIVVWNRGTGKQAENCAKFLSKGKKAYIEGEIETTSYDDRNTGEKKFTTKIIASDVKFLTPVDNQSGHQAHAAPANKPQLDNMNFPQHAPAPASNQPSDIDFDSIPF